MNSCAWMSLRTAIAASALVLGAGSASAENLQDFEAAWTGASFGNNVNISATITLDTDLLFNPGISNGAVGAPGSVFHDISMTVTGSDIPSSDGTFGASSFQTNFNYIMINQALDINTEWVGQAQTSGDQWGIVAPGFQFSHDFNLFSSDGLAPSGTDFYVLRVADGEPARLTSFHPVPAPGAMVLCGVGGAAMIRRRRGE